jgi:hypothetical protein
MISISTFNLLSHSLFHQKRTSSLLSIGKTCANFYGKQNQFKLFKLDLNYDKDNINREDKIDIELIMMN